MGAQQILDAITADARADCERIAAEAEAEAAAGRERALAAARSKADAARSAADAQAADAERRRLLTAGIEARRNSLAARRGLLERAFSAALDRLCALEGERYLDFIRALVVPASQTGRELVEVPEGARARFTAPYCGEATALEALNGALAAAGRRGELSLSPESGSFRGGFRLVGEEADVDCSFESLLAEWRDAHEAEAYDRLFGSEA